MFFHDTSSQFAMLHVAWVCRWHFTHFGGQIQEKDNHALACLGPRVYEGLQCHNDTENAGHGIAGVLLTWALQCRSVIGLR